MKMRVWGGRRTLATEQGKEIKNAHDLETWLATQGDGTLEVWAGRWWLVSVEAVPFTVKARKCHCAHPKYRSKNGLDTHDFPGFFAHEAYRVGMKAHKTWGGISSFASSVCKKVSEDGFDE